ncbi:type 1 glutamine amidotransferase [Leadbetterella sp. DM7]|uniref:type 1 glutamine amidotransferase n=1 Tax=Leadbetterella sp. DM7 TaxID=3235085 RepID=UPI00349E67AD
MGNFRIGVLDMNNGAPNEGMRCIKYLIEEFFMRKELETDYQVFDVRRGDTLPAYDEFDAYISSGGPGSPLLEGTSWERDYFKLLGDVLEHNRTAPEKIFFFAICHSFQLVVQYFELAQLTRRKSTSFGVMPTHIVEGEEGEPLFRGLENPFWVVDSRDYQVVQPDSDRFQTLGARILCLEKERPHVDLERAVMAIRFTNEVVGTQFHPEADAEGMYRHFQTEEKKKAVIENFGEEKLQNMLESLEDPDKIMLTESVIIPTFLEIAFQHKPEPVWSEK